MRRVTYWKALVHDPEIIILDEPTAGVDIDIRKLSVELYQKNK